MEKHTESLFFLAFQCVFYDMVDYILRLNTLILSGQSELWDKLQTQAYRAIRHRVDVECFLTTYDYAQTKAYVEKQLAYAGRTSPLFTDEALRCIYDYSRACQD